MKIGVVPAYSITAYKQLSAFPKGTCETLGITNITTEFHTWYSEFLMFCAQPSLTRIMAGTRSTLDIMVCHVEPVEPAIVAQNFGHKTVLVISDLEMVRSLKPNTLEATALSKADGIVYVTDVFKDYVENKYKIKTTENTCVAPICVSKKDYLTPTTTRGGIVYQGSIFPPSIDTRFRYRNFDSLFDSFQDLDMRIDVIPSPHSANKLEYYKKKYSFMVNKHHTQIGSGWEVKEAMVQIHPSLPFHRMLEALGEYHWGFMGTDFEDTYLERALPHKVFDYMAAGIPMISMNCSYAAKFIEKEGIGITVKSVKEIKERYDEWEECQKNVLAVRDKWVMENHVDKVINVFENAINGGK